VGEYVFGRRGRAGWAAQVTTGFGAGYTVTEAVLGAALALRTRVTGSGEAVNEAVAEAVADGNRVDVRRSVLLFE
jgi:hypothetical protein